MFARSFGSGSVTTIVAGHTRVWDRAFRTSHSVVGQLRTHQYIACQPAIESRRHQSSAVCITSTVLSDRQRDMPVNRFADHSGNRNVATGLQPAVIGRWPFGPMRAPGYSLYSWASW